MADRNLKNTVFKPNGSIFTPRIVANICMSNTATTAGNFLPPTLGLGGRIAHWEIMSEFLFAFRMPLKET